MLDLDRVNAVRAAVARGKPDLPPTMWHGMHDKRVCSILEPIQLTLFKVFRVRLTP